MSSEGISYQFDSRELLFSWWRHQRETISALLDHRSPVDPLHKGQWRRALICAWTNGWSNNREAGDLRRLHPHFDATVMFFWWCSDLFWCYSHEIVQCIPYFIPQCYVVIHIIFNILSHCCAVTPWVSNSLVTFGSDKGKPFHESVPDYCQLDPWQHFSVKFPNKIRYKHFRPRECIDISMA